MIDTWRVGPPDGSLQAGSMIFHGGNFNRSSPHQVCKRFVNPSSLLSSYFSHLILFKVCVSIWRLVFLASHKLPPPVHSNFFSFLSFSINASLYVQSYKMPIYLHRAKTSICDNFVTLTKQIWLKTKLCDDNGTFFKAGCLVSTILHIWQKCQKRASFCKILFSPKCSATNFHFFYTDISVIAFHIAVLYFQMTIQRSSLGQLTSLSRDTLHLFTLSRSIWMSVQLSDRWETENPKNYFVANSNFRVYCSSLPGQRLVRLKRSLPICKLSSLPICKLSCSEKKNLCQFVNFLLQLAPRNLSQKRNLSDFSPNP